MVSSHKIVILGWTGHLSVTVEEHRTITIKKTLQKTHKNVMKPYRISLRLLQSFNGGDGAVKNGGICSKKGRKPLVEVKQMQMEFGRDSE